MSRHVLPWSFSFILILLCGISIADITCNITRNACAPGDVLLFTLSNFTNAMANMTDISTSYPYSLCCGNSTYDLGRGTLPQADKWDYVVNLSNQTSAHGRIDGNDAEYQHPISMFSNDYTFDCVYALVRCPVNYTCLFKMSSASNAHFANCSTWPGYDISVCCTACPWPNMNRTSCENCSNFNWKWNDTYRYYEDPGRTTNASCCGDSNTEFYREDEYGCNACCNQSEDYCYMNVSGGSECSSSITESMIINGTVWEQQVDNLASFLPSDGALVEIMYASNMQPFRRSYTINGNYSLAIPLLTIPLVLSVSKHGFDTVTMNIDPNLGGQSQNATLYLTGDCRPDCSRYVVTKDSGELRCDAACDGINLCQFNDSFSAEKQLYVKDLCDGMKPGWEAHFNYTIGGEYIVRCCNNTPILKPQYGFSIKALQSQNLFTVASAGFTYKGKPVVVYITSWD